MNKTATLVPNNDDPLTSSLSLTIKYDLELAVKLGSITASVIYCHLQNIEKDKKHYYLDNEISGQYNGLPWTELVAGEEAPKLGLSIKQWEQGIKVLIKAGKIYTTQLVALL